MAITLSGDSPNLTSASLTTPTLTSPTFAGTPSGSIITSGTAVASTSGTSIDFTSIPSWVKRITVMFNGVSTNGSSNLQVQMGSGSVTTSGYNAETSNGGSANFATTGITVTFSNASSYSRVGSLTLSLINNNTWIGQIIMADISGSATCHYTSGVTPAFGGSIDRLRITTVNGTDTFDAGSINILYE